MFNQSKIRIMEKIDFTKVVTFRENGVLKRLTATISLDDECRNNCCDFHIRGKVDYKAKNNCWINESCGCVHDDISKHIKSFAPFIALHLCNYKGQPMYSIENGMFFMREDFKRGMNYLRITEEEYNKLYPAAVMQDKLYIKYMLFHLGIVDRWQKEANELISFIQEKSGRKWENPYSSEEERFMLHISQDEIDEIESKIKKGFYSEQSFKERIEKKKSDDLNKKRQEIIDKYDRRTEKARNERDVMLYILDHGFPVDNVIYYDYNNTAKFNWKNYDKKITQEQFVDFVNSLEYDKLPKGIEFILGDK